MNRIKTSLVSKVFTDAGKAIREAGGDDKVTTPNELENALYPSTAKRDRFAKQFYEFALTRGGNPDGLSEKDLNAAIAFARKNLVSAFDENKNGLSKAEVSKMAALGKLAVSVAEDVEKGKATAKLAAQFSKAAEGVYYISETDSQPKFVAGSFSGSRVTEGAIRQGLDATLLSFLNRNRVPGEPLASDAIAFDVYSRRERDAFFERLVTPADPNDSDLSAYARGFRKMLKLAEKELSDIRVVRVAPKGLDGKILENPGFCAYLIVGKANETGLLSGVMFGSVET